MKGIGDWLVKRSRLNGDRLAVIYKDRRLTYRQLNDRVNRFANALTQLGVRKGDRVAGLLLNGNEMLETMFACAKLGAIFVPVNFRLTASEVEYILLDAGVHVFLYDERLLKTADAICHRMKFSHVIQVGNQPAHGQFLYEMLLAENANVEPEYDVDLEDIHLMMYTSGTTGRPKGALLSHANTQWNAIYMLNDITLLETDITLTVAPMFHIGAMNVFTTPLLYKGGTVVIDDKFDPYQTLATIEREKITVLFMVPAMWQALTQVPEFDKYDLRSLRIGVSGGAPCPLTIIEFFETRGIPMMEGFGLTETAPFVSFLKPEHASRKHGSVGTPAFHVDVRIVDDHGRDLPTGDVGELLVRGPNVMKGYWNNPAATREVLKDGWFHTGDLARMDDEGFLYIVDRKKDMIITGGENVYPVEVEQVLYRHPNIKEVAVIGVYDEKWGESVKAVVALEDETQPLSIEQLWEFCEGKLARFKIPKFLEIVPELPRNATGKILKTVLRNSDKLAGRNS